MNGITVVITCFNQGRVIDESVDSILDQTYMDFNIIIVDDGSTDEFTLEKLQNYCKPKTRVLHTVNRGPAAARNAGIALAVSDNILILDADDKFHPTFLERAMAIINSEENVGIVTCGVQMFGSSDTIWIPKGGDIRNFLVESGACGNSLFRKKCWEDAGGYNEQIEGYEDWDFWISITKFGWIAKTIPEPLFYYRVQNGSSRYKLNLKSHYEILMQIVTRHQDVYRKYFEYLLGASQKTLLNRQKVSGILYLLILLPGHLNELGIIPTDNEAELHQSIGCGRFENTFAYIDQSERWLRKLEEANRKMEQYPETAFSQVLANRFWVLCNSVTRLGLGVFIRYFSSSLRKVLTLDLLEKIKFLIKCVLRYETDMHKIENI